MNGQVAAGRRFGLVVGGAFLVLAIISRWRGHETAPTIVAAVGAALMLGGLLAPRHMQPVERAWLRFGHALSRITTPIVMAVLYFVALTPIGIVRRMVSRNPLKHEIAASGYWKPRPPGRRRSASMDRQF